MSAPLRIATRSSRLALWQANHVAALLTPLLEDRGVELVHVSTLGDRDRSGPLSSFGGQGVFTREVQSAVINNEADIAVHSLKDLPTITTAGLTLAGVPERAPVFDSLIVWADSTFRTLDELPRGAAVATGSPRRRAQLLHRRPDLKMVDVRGNVDTRLRKLDSGEFDVLILAEAGLGRLGLADRLTSPLSPPLMYPAVGQGALGLECRADDVETRSLLERITVATVKQAVIAERSCLATLRAGCHAPVGVYSTLEDETLRLEAVVLSLDGRERVHARAERPVSEAGQLGIDVAQELIRLGAQPLLDLPGPASEGHP